MRRVCKQRGKEKKRQILRQEKYLTEVKNNACEYSINEEEDRTKSEKKYLLI